jgi:hypothetical protein
MKNEYSCGKPRSVWPGRAGNAAVAGAAALASSPACASFLSGDALDTAADVLAWVVLVIAPIIGIGLFLIVHVLPEKIAERRHHPQKAAIQTLCLLSLVFGGLLWPLAWLWAFTRPTQYRMAYGTEKHDNYFREMGERAARGELPPAERDALREELDAMATRGVLPADLRELRRRLNAAPETAPSVASAGAAPERSL